jgi:hypothetical protein
MRRRAVVTICFYAACSLGTPVGAQSVAKSLETHVRNTVGDIWAVWTSPVRGTGSDWLVALGAIGGSAALTVVDDDLDRWIVKHQDARAWGPLKEVREGGIAFSGRTITPVAVGALVLALATNNQRLQEGLFGCLASYTSTSVMRNFVFYRLVSRMRPDSGRNPPPSPPASEGDQYDFGFPGTSRWGEHSFPAGHVTNIMACASFLGHRFSMGLAEPAVYVLVAGVGTGRLIDRRHWLSDTALGLILGYAVGKEVALRSSRREERLSARTALRRSAEGLSITPTRNGVGISWQRTF